MKISKSDHVLLLLKSELKRLKSQSLGTRSTETDNSRPSESVDDLKRLKALISNNDLTEHQVHQAVVRNILSNEFGISVSNDPGFIALSDRVTKALREDEQSKDIITALLSSIIDS